MCRTCGITGIAEKKHTAEQQGQWETAAAGAMRFGERAAMLELAHKRVEELKKEFPKAHAVDPDDVRVIYVITDDPDKYAEHVGA